MHMQRAVMQDFINNFTWRVTGFTGLTTASLKLILVRKTSRSFHYWQPAPTCRWRLLPWQWQILATQPWAPMLMRNRHPSHCWISGKGVGGELPGWSAATTKNARKIPPERMPSYDPQARGVPTHAHMCRHRWLPGECKHPLLLTP